MLNLAPKSHIVFSYKTPLGHEISIARQSFGPPSGKRPEKRISIVAGLHGDELEGVYLCFRLARYLADLAESRPSAIKGEAHIYPALNPQALGNVSRLWPFFGCDLNRLFGQNHQSLPGRAAQSLLEDIGSRSDFAVDLHASNLHLWEAPQVRILEGLDKKLIPLAMETSVDVIWVHPFTTVFEYTLGYNLNRMKIPTLVIEGGICLRIDMGLNDRIFNGLINMMAHIGILALNKNEIPKVEKPRLVNPDHVAQVTAPQTGFFVSRKKVGSCVSQGDVLGEMVDISKGVVIGEIRSPADGFLFTLRSLPVTYSGAVLARIATSEPFNHD